ncbi:Caspase and apoptosis inhibitor 1 [Mactra antiquata]
MKKKSPEREFDENDLDLDKEINPIGHYVKDREQLLEEMFHCVKGPSLDRAIPEVLKDISIQMLDSKVKTQDLQGRPSEKNLTLNDQPLSPTFEY